MPDSHSLFKSYLIVTSNKTACESTRETYFVWTLRSGFGWGALSLCYGGHRKRLISARIFHLFIYSFLTLLFLVEQTSLFLWYTVFVCVFVVCVDEREKKRQTVKHKWNDRHVYEHTDNRKIQRDKDFIGQANEQTDTHLTKQKASQAEMNLEMYTDHLRDRARKNRRRQRSQ